MSQTNLPQLTLLKEKDPSGMQILEDGVVAAGKKINLLERSAESTQWAGDTQSSTRPIVDDGLVAALLLELKLEKEGHRSQKEVFRLPTRTNTGARLQANTIVGIDPHIRLASFTFHGRLFDGMLTHMGKPSRLLRGFDDVELIDTIMFSASVNAQTFEAFSTSTCSLCLASPSGIIPTDIQTRGQYFRSRVIGWEPELQLIAAAA